MGKQNNDSINIIPREYFFYTELGNFCNYIKNKKICSQLIAKFLLYRAKIEKVIPNICLNQNLIELDIKDLSKKEKCYINNVFDVLIVSSIVMNEKIESDYLVDLSILLTLIENDDVFFEKGELITFFKLFYKINKLEAIEKMINSTSKFYTSLDKKQLSKFYTQTLDGKTKNEILKQFQDLQLKYKIVLKKYLPNPFNILQNDETIYYIPFDMELSLDELTEQLKIIYSLYKKNKKQIKAETIRNDNIIKALDFEKKILQKIINELDFKTTKIPFYEKLVDVLFIYDNQAINRNIENIKQELLQFYLGKPNTPYIDSLIKHIQTIFNKVKSINHILDF